MSDTEIACAAIIIVCLTEKKAENMDEGMAKEEGRPVMTV
jgi:hypothetical protein